MLEPNYAVLDETDSGLDIDALKIVAHGVNSLRGPEPRRAFDHALSAAFELHRARSCACDGDRDASCGAAARNWRCELEEKGYDWVRDDVGEASASPND